MLRTLFLFLALSFLPASYSKAQTATHITDSGWRLGLNIGGAYQGSPIGQTELDPAFGMGWGATLGRMIYQEPGAFFNLGLRGRFLWEMSKGVSTDPTYAIGVHPRKGNDKRYDYDVVGQRYQDSVGYLYPNYRQEGREYDLEVTIGFNRLAEQTNLFFYLFGGVGVINYQIRTNQLDENGSVYRYDQKFSGEPSKADLRDFWDDTYETEVYEGGKIDRFIPSGGFGVIYQITPSLGVGLEHKIGWPENEDRFDGKEFKNGFDPRSSPKGVEHAYDQFDKTSRKDLFHYTALRFRWRIVDDGKEDKEPEDEPSADDYTPADDKDNKTYLDPPKVDITAPSKSPYRTQKDSFLLKASIENVVKEENVTLSIDGAPFGDPNLDLANDQLTQKIALNKGGNRIRIRAVNDRGSDADRVLIVRKADTLPRPKVKITEPSQDPYQTYSPSKLLKANVLNVEEKDSITFLFNGSAHSFQFDPKTGALKADLDLIMGANVVKVQARNEKGKGRDEGTIIYKREASIDPPQVWVVYPSLDPRVVLNPNTVIRARVKGVRSRFDITVTQNGDPVTDFNYYPDDDLLTMQRTLKKGKNLFRFKVENKGGRDKAVQRIILKDEKQPPPVVNFQRPSASGNTVSNKTYRVKAHIKNVNARSGIRFKMNGSSRSDFVFDPSSGKLVYDADLKKGVNKFRIRASNDQGVDRASRTVRYKKQSSAQPPQIHVEKPTKDPYKSSEEKPRVLVKVENVSDKSGLQVRLNGNSISDYQYDPNTGALKVQKPLMEGRNEYRFVASNDAGMVSTGHTLVYSPKQAPSVNILRPSGGKTTVNNKVFALRAKLLRVSSDKDIICQVNGRKLKNFDFDPKTGVLRGKISLDQGLNKVFLQGKNSSGKDDDRVKLQYKPPKPPSVNITKPVSDPHQTNKKKITIKGKVSGVSGPKEIDLIDKGQLTQNFQYLSSGRFKYTMSLKPGKNQFKVQVHNDAGQDIDTRTIQRNTTNYLRGKDDGKSGKAEEKGKDKEQKPDVDIERPSSKETTVNGVRLVARVEHAKKAKVLLNGDPQTFSFSGDRIEADLSLEKGENRIEVQVENDVGSAKDVTTLTFDPVKSSGGASEKKKPQEEPEKKDDGGQTEEEEKKQEKSKDQDEKDDGGSKGGGQIDKKDKEKDQDDAGKKGGQIDKKDKEKDQDEGGKKGGQIDKKDKRR